MSTNFVNINDNELWIEITDQKGFLMFGDLSRLQIEKGTKISSTEVDIFCSNCRHKYTFEKDIERGRIWNWWKWRVFLKGNQISKDKHVYYTSLEVRFYCTHCQENLPPQNDERYSKLKVIK